jgi:hypothetical protein
MFQQVQMHCDRFVLLSPSFLLSVSSSNPPSHPLSSQDLLTFFHPFRCGGRGKTIKHLCSSCKGHRIVETQTELNLHVDRGMPEGAEVVFEGEADESPDWVAGDVIVRVKSKKVKGGFVRKESNLYWTEPISVAEVRSLFFLLVPLSSPYTLRRLFWASGTRSRVSMDTTSFSSEQALRSQVRPSSLSQSLQSSGRHSPSLLSSSTSLPPSSARSILLTSSHFAGYVDVIHGEGMPIYHLSGHGDLFVEYQVILPPSLTPPQSAGPSPSISFFSS